MGGYSDKAQPFLDVIAAAIFSSPEVRDWIIRGSPWQEAYSGSDVLIDEQRRMRWKRGATRQPFWANYWCGLDSRCTCRGDGTGIETDAIFFLRNRDHRVLAIHLEFKHPNERFGLGQREAYARRARCFQETFRKRPTVNPHDDWTTVLVCDEKSATEDTRSYFQRVITHGEAAEIIDHYPAPLL